MAIEYHEGLPGAGKSYEAVVYHIIPALKDRRSVVTNIRGMNYEKLAELTGQPLQMVQLLLINIEPAEQDSEVGEVQRCINQMCDQTPDNALIVWDEIQDYFPSGNVKLPLNQQKFWTEHRHRGLDIVIMGQDRSDVHKLIRNRIRTVIYFLKQEAIGRPNHYKWEIYQKQKLGKFEKTGSGTREYDSKFFGTYMSHRREGTRSKVYTTSRTNMLANSTALSMGVPLAFCAAAFAVWHLWGFFHAEPPASTHMQSVSAQKQPTAVLEPAEDTNPWPADMDPAGGSTETQVVVTEEQRVPVDYFDKMAQTYQVRSMGHMASTKPGKELMGYIELLDATYHQKEKFSLADIRALGWTVTLEGYGLLITKGDISYVARAWPIDVNGRVDQKTVQSLQGDSAKRSAQEGNTGNSSSRDSVVVVGSSKPGHLW